MLKMFLKQSVFLLIAAAAVVGFFRFENCQITAVADPDPKIYINVSELLSEITLTPSPHNRILEGTSYKGLTFTTQWCANGISGVYPDFWERSSTGSFTLPSGYTLESLEVTGAAHIFDVTIHSSDPDNEDIQLTGKTGVFTINVYDCGWRESSSEVSITAKALPGYDQSQFQVRNFVLTPAFDYRLPMPQTDFDARTMKLTNFAPNLIYSIEPNVWVPINTLNNFILFNEYDQLNLDYGIRIRRLATPTEILQGFEDSKIKVIPLSRRPAAEGLISAPVSGSGLNNGKIMGVTESMEYKLSENGFNIDCFGNISDSEITNLSEGEYYIRYKGNGYTLPGVYVRKDVCYSSATPNALFDAYTMQLSGITPQTRYKIGGDRYDLSGWVTPVLQNGNYAVLTDMEFENAEPILYIKETGSGQLQDSDPQIIVLSKEMRVVKYVTRRNLRSQNGSDGQLLNLTMDMEYRHSDWSYYLPCPDQSGVVNGLDGGVYYVRYKGNGHVLPGVSVNLLIEYVDNMTGASFDTSTLLLTNVTNQMEYSTTSGMKWVDIKTSSVDLSEAAITVADGVWVKLKVLQQSDDPIIQEINLTKHGVPAVTVSGGIVSGVDNTMEYKASGDSSYAPVLGMTLSLTPGRYQFRIKGSGHTLASDVVNVVILNQTVDGVTVVNNLSRRVPFGDIYAKNSNDEPLPAITKVSEGMAPGMAVSVFGEHFDGKVWVKMSDGINEWVIMPEQIDSYGQYLRFIWPDYITPGVYTIQVSNDDGENWSVQEGYVNAPNGQWSNDSGIYTGIEVNLYGRNLDARQYDKSIIGDSPTMVRVIEVAQPDSASGRLIQVIKPNTVTPYHITFNAPPVQSNKFYIVQVQINSAGLGSDWVTAMTYPDGISQLVWTGINPPSFNTDSVVGRPDTNKLIREMNMSWVGDFNWDNVYDAVSYGADPTGQADSTSAIQSAIDAAGNAGGGVVYLKEGTYKLTGGENLGYGYGAVNCLVLWNGVILQGAGRGSDDEYLTVLNYDTTSLITGNPPGSGYKPDLHVIRTFGNGFNGVVGIKGTIGQNVHDIIGTPMINAYFTCLGGANGVWAGSYTDVFLYDCYIDMGINARAHKAAGGNANRVLVANNTLISGRASYHYSGGGSYFTFRDNHMRYGDGNYGVSADYQVISDNNIEIIFTMPDNYEELIDKYLVGEAQWSDISSQHGYISEDVHGLFIYPVSRGCHYVGNNTLGGAYSVIGMNNCELVAFDSVTAQGRSDEVLSAGSDWLIFADGLSSYLGWESEYMINIMEGTGIGQMRLVRAGNIEYLGGAKREYKVTIDKPWDVIPDETSVIIIGHPHINNVVERNYLYEAGNGAIQYYFGCWDNVSSENTIVDTNGIQIWGANTNPYGGYPNIFFNTYFSDIRDNYVEGYIRKVPNRANANNYPKSVGIFQRGEEDYLYITPIAPQLFANEFRNNIINTTGGLPQGIGAMAGGTFTAYSHPRADEGRQSATGRRIAAALYENNTSVDSQYSAVNILQTSIYGSFVKDTTASGTTPDTVYDMGMNTYFMQDGNFGLWRNWIVSASNGSGGTPSSVASSSGKWITTQTSGTISLTIDTGVRSVGTGNGTVEQYRPFRVIDRIGISSDAVSGTLKVYSSLTNGDWGSPVLTIPNVSTADFINKYVYLDDLAQGRWFKFDFENINGALSISDIYLLPHEQSLPKRYNVMPDLTPSLEITRSYWSGGYDSGSKSDMLISEGLSGDGLGFYGVAVNRGERVIVLDLGSICRINKLVYQSIQDSGQITAFMMYYSINNTGEDLAILNESADWKEIPKEIGGNASYATQIPGLGIEGFCWNTWTDARDLNIDKAMTFAPVLARYVKIVPLNVGAGTIWTGSVTSDLLKIFGDIINPSDLCTVDYDFNDGLGEPYTLVIDKNTKLQNPGDPTRASYIFLGWFNNEIRWDFSNPVTTDMTLRAKWRYDSDIIIDVPEMLENVTIVRNGRNIPAMTEYKNVIFTTPWCIGNGRGLYPDFFEYHNPGTFIIPEGYMLKSLTLTCAAHFINITISSSNNPNETIVLAQKTGKFDLNISDYNWSEPAGAVSLFIDTNGSPVGNNDRAQFAMLRIVYTPIVGAYDTDINDDDQTDAGDLALLLDNYGKLGDNLADIDNNGLVDSHDLSLLLDNYGKYSFLVKKGG